MLYIYFLVSQLVPSNQLFQLQCIRAKGKAITVEAWRGPEDSRGAEASRF